IPTRASETALMPPRSTETSSAAPSKARSGTAMTSANSARVPTEDAFQPDTRTLQTSVSVTMASAATRETTNTGMAAGWLGRSTNGSRAMIFGAASNSSAAHHGPAPAVANAGTNPRSPLDSETAATTLDAPACGTNGTVKPKWNRAESRIMASPADRSACTANGAWT